MKLKEFLNNVVFANGPIESIHKDRNGNNIFDYNINSPFLNIFKEELQKCDEFKECELIILDRPTIEDTEGKPYLTQTLKITDDIKFKGKAFLYGIFLSQEIYDPLKMNVAVKDGCSISSNMYDPINLIPKKAIRIEFNPEELQEAEATKENGENLKRKELHQKLDNILDNPEEYRIIGDKAVMIRGLCESYEMNGQESEFKDYSKLNPNEQNPTHSLVYYMENGPVVNNIMSMTIKHKFIPSKLKDKFMAEFGDKGLSTTEAEINKFLEDNKL